MDDVADFSYLFDPRYRQQPQPVMTPFKPVAPPPSPVGQLAALAPSSIALARKAQAPAAPTKPTVGGPEAFAPPPVEQGQPVAPGPTPSVTAANNNPGNVTDGKGGFVSYSSPVEGVRATVNNARAYPGRYNGGAPMSLNHIAAYWAPGPQPDQWNKTARDPNNPMLKGNNPQQWAKNVASIMGVSPDTPIDLRDPATARAFAKGAHVAEYGQSNQYNEDIYAQGAQ